MAATLVAGLMHMRELGHATRAELVNLDEMPDLDNTIFSGELRKCAFYGAMGSKPVFVCVTETSVFISKHQHDNVCMHRIPLHEVTSVSATSPASSGSSVESFEIATQKGGHNLGRTYRFEAETEEIKAKWHRILREAAEAARSRIEEADNVGSCQRLINSAKELHDADHFQQFFGAVIMGSFTVSLIQTEMVPSEGSSADFVFFIIDIIMTALFTIELIVTFVGHFGLLFMQDAWRIFDTIVVAVSYVGLSGTDMPAVKSIRALRVLRAVRLLKKSKSLKPIVDALFASILPVCNSMLLLALITAIYASMAVGLFGEQSPVLFGRLSRSMFTMFQICTGDEWGPITRDLFGEEGIVQPVPVLFFLSYMLIASIVLTNIVIAVRSSLRFCCDAFHPN
jgi:voltage-gated sodium channel